MKKIFQQLRSLTFFVMPASMLVLCSWENPGMQNYSNRTISSYQVQKDTIPKEKQDDVDKAMKQLDVQMDNLDVQMKDLDINIDKQLESLSKIDFDKIQQQTQQALKEIDWGKIQQNVTVALENAQQQIAAIDFSKMKSN